MKTERQLSKSELLQWVNDITKIPAYKLEDLSTGVHFCHILHIYTKGGFSLQKVKTDARNELDSLHNLKLLQYGMEDHKIPYKFDVAFEVIQIILVSKKNFRTILEMLQLWRKLFQKLIRGGQFTDYPRPKVTIQITKPLNMNPPLDKSENKIEKSSDQIKHDQVLHILEQKNQESLQKETLIIEENKCKELKSQKKEPFYQPILYPAFKHFDESINRAKTEEKKLNDANANENENIPFSRAKMHNFSFGIQTSPIQVPNEKSPQEKSEIKVKERQNKEDTPMNFAQKEEQLYPSLEKKDNHEDPQNESRIPITQKQIEKAQTTGKQSKSREDYYISRPKSIPKPMPPTPQQNVERRDLSPKLSQRTNLLSTMQQSENKVGRLI